MHTLVSFAVGVQWYVDLSVSRFHGPGAVIDRESFTTDGERTGQGVGSAL